MFAWLKRRKERAAALRLAQRRMDALHRWPHLYRLSEGRPMVFIDLVARVTVGSPAWRYEREWQHTPEDPGRWLAARLSEEYHKQHGNQKQPG